ncbi:MAG: 30S ribosomal protein S9 [Candidatus Omnitrophica bacterium]|nr:30S ribosomal protein S9 [Candidatus Omnitrophota bacterium]
MAKKVTQSKVLKGKRKSAVSRVKLSGGKGNFEVNGKSLDKYFISEIQQMLIKEPLTITETITKYDVMVNVKGGGLSGQAGATRLAIARGLILQEPDLRNVLKKAGFLTCDARQKERKKYGQKKARKRFQFSKR